MVTEILLTEQVWMVGTNFDEGRTLDMELIWAERLMKELVMVRRRKSESNCYWRMNYSDLITHSMIWSINFE
jgi:hypothetical protein